MNQPVIRYSPTPKQDEAFEILEDADVRLFTFGGGAGGGKSILGCNWIIINAERYPGSRWFIGRKKLIRLKQSVLLQLYELMNQYGYKLNVHYRISPESYIEFWNKSRIYLLDLDYYPADPMYERLGSTEYTGGFVEEASEVEELAIEVLLTRCRYKLDQFGITPKILMTCNPSKKWLYRVFYKPWKEGTLPKDKRFLRALAIDNPHNSRHYLDSLKNTKDRVTRERLWFGNWEYDDSDLALMTYDAISDIYTNNVEAGPDRYIIVDAARFGVDQAVFMLWNGYRVVKIAAMDKSATTEIEEQIRRWMNEYNVPLSNVLVDEEGVGGGIVDHMRCKGFVGNASPYDNRKDSEKRQTEFKINYKNLRAQCYHLLSQKVEDREIKVDTEDVKIQQEITEELEQIRRTDDVGKDAKFQIIAKEDIKKNLGRSPDYADTLMMRMFFDVNKPVKRARAFSSKPSGF